MSEIYSMSRKDRINRSHSIDLSVVGEDRIDHVLKILSGFSKHAGDRALGSAIKRASQSGLAYAAKAIHKEYFISEGDFKRYTRSKRHIIVDKDGTSVYVEFRGYHIPLLLFNTRIGNDGKVYARVKRTSNQEVLNHVFEATVGEHGHTGIFERKTKNRLPIEEKLGPATPQMMWANEDVYEAIDDKVREVFDQRLEHELNAFLSGYRE